MSLIHSLLALPVALVLASQSPRRQKLLEQIGLKFTVLPSTVDESLVDASLTPLLYSAELARRKAQDVANRLSTPAIVVGADTIVVSESIILNKPATPEEAKTMLRQLSGRIHTVHTAVSLQFAPDGIENTQVSSTEVTFRELSDDEISRYVAGGSPMDKAGAYGIQDDFGAVFVSKIVGDYYTVVGLPLEQFYRQLGEVSRSILNRNLTID